MLPANKRFVRELPKRRKLGAKRSGTRSVLDVKLRGNL